VERINIETVIDQVESQTGVRCEVYSKIGNDDTLVIPADQLRTVVDVLLDSIDGVQLSTITAQQRADQLDVIEVMVHFWRGSGLSLMMTLPGKSPQVESLVSIIPGADFYEREVAEMFGVKFTGREETPPLLLPDSWDQGPPFIHKELNNE